MAYTVWISSISEAGFKKDGHLGKSFVTDILMSFH